MQKKNSAIRFDALAVGDLHLERFNSNYFNGIIEDSVEMQLNALRSYCKIAKKDRIKNIIMLGDIVDHPNPKQSTIIRLISVFRDFPELKFWVITGNHDITARGRNGLQICEFLSSANMLENVIVFTEPKMVNIKGFPVYFMPYGYDVQPKGTYLGIGHHTVTGSLSDSGYKLEDSGISISNKKAYWVMGHIHLKQSYKWGCYPGTPYQINFGESTEKYLLKVKATLDAGKLTVKRKFLPVDTPYTLETLNLEDVSQLPKFNKKKPNFFKIRIRDGFELPSTFLIDNPHIIAKDILNKKGKLTEITKIEDAPDTVFHLTATSNLVPFLVKKGMSEKEAKSARKLIKKIQANG